MLVTRTFDMLSAPPVGFPTYRYRPAGGSWTAPTNAGVAQIGSSLSFAIDLPFDPGIYAGAWDPGDGNLITDVFTVGAIQSGDAFARLGSPSGVSISADIQTVASAASSITVGQVQTACSAALAATPVTVATVRDKAGYILAPSGLDAVVVEAGINARQALAPILAASAGVISGAGTGTIVIKGGDSTITRITAVTDNAGNRSSIGLNLPG